MWAYAGEYEIEVKYFGQPVAGSPFTAKAWDMNKVNVSNVVQGRVGLQSSFNSKSSPLFILCVFIPLTPTVAIWVQLQSILCKTGLSRHL